MSVTSGPFSLRKWLRSSIRVRLLVFGGLWVSAALILGYAIIFSILESFIYRRFDEELDVMGDALIAAAAADETTGYVTLSAVPTDPRFQVPLSGWFWQLTQDGQVVAKSSSLFDNVLNPPDQDLQGAAGLGPAHEALRVTRHSFTLPDTSAHMAVTITAPQAEIDARLTDIRYPLLSSLIIMALGLFAAVYLQVSAGLSGLDRLGRDIRKVRAGQSSAVPLPHEAEIRQVSIEINELLEYNRTILARSREHVGNLAHSLKTPLAALGNARLQDQTAQALIDRMDRQIRWHLRRARSSGAGNVLGYRTDIHEVILDILMVLRRPIEDAGFSVSIDCPPGLSFAGERQDLEELIGNLSENAVKWAKSQIRISARPIGPDSFSLTIEDDGPGLSESDYPQALSRGTRLDEHGPPGTGLGLSIVSDIAALHGGKLLLSRSDLGGLSAGITLPMAPQLTQK